MGNTAHHLDSVPEWTFGDRLRRIRRTLGITQDAMAQILGEKTVTYSAWETDANKPRNLITVAKRLELATGVPASWTLGINDGSLPKGPDDGGSAADSVNKLLLNERVPLATSGRHLAAVA